MRLGRASRRRSAFSTEFSAANSDSAIDGNRKLCRSAGQQNLADTLPFSHVANEEFGKWPNELACLRCRQGLRFKAGVESQ